MHVINGDNQFCCYNHNVPVYQILVRQLWLRFIKKLGFNVFVIHLHNLFNFSGYDIGLLIMYFLVNNIGYYSYNHDSWQFSFFYPTLRFYSYNHGSLVFFTQLSTNKFELLTYHDNRKNIFIRLSLLKTCISYT